MLDLGPDGLTQNLHCCRGVQLILFCRAKNRSAWYPVPSATATTYIAALRLSRSPRRLKSVCAVIIISCISNCLTKVPVPPIMAGRKASDAPVAPVLFVIRTRSPLNGDDAKENAKAHLEIRHGGRRCTLRQAKARTPRLDDSISFKKGATHSPQRFSIHSAPVSTLTHTGQ